ncbi:hypothetical protein [Leptolyngbya sp. FACHB-17]|uniref:hypothetical protein n=1 Tax=unclassified Leptolyngbya TaxID=2650499 RepID=UPI0016801248|nr:hypothetical protein [Leptolyngbya sp. FACHB-17]MBD2083031.1 hypothetical protein [Leptolyngbya sp. FACHB-17]
MSEFDFDSLLQKAFEQCERLGHPLDADQKEILRSTLQQETRSNPLTQLTEEQRQAVLQFAQQSDWKTSLLNDWLQNRNSGAMQFIRDQYGLSWLNSVTAEDLAAYRDQETRLNIGDRIEVSNALWEWVQADDQEWYTCTVIGLSESDNSQQTRCTIRFDNGQEYEIQGVYDWNRSNWR